MKKTMEERLFNVFALIIETIFALLCVVPLILTVSGSFTAERELFSGGLSLIPKRFSTAAYELILKDPLDMLNAYKVTIIITLAGTALCLLITSMTSYVLYRKDFKYRNAFSFYFFFTTLFSGGLVPGYILMCSLGLRDTYTVLIITGVFSVMNMIIMRTYFTSNIPMAIIESAKIDGANDFRIYISGVLPLSIPILATVGLLTALGYWNNWNTAMMYITDRNLYPLQYYLYRIFAAAEFQSKLSELGVSLGEETPTESYKLAMTVFTMGPVVLFYPFIQKYFVSGMTIGAVKE